MFITYIKYTLNVLNFYKGKFVPNSLPYAMYCCHCFN